MATNENRAKHGPDWVVTGLAATAARRVPQLLTVALRFASSMSSFDTRLGSRETSSYDAEVSEDSSSEAALERYNLTRRQVAQRIGVSVSTVRRMEHVELHPMDGPGGVVLFDPAEVDQLPRRSPRTPPSQVATDPTQRAKRREGQLAAKVFRMFARNWTLPQVVVATRQPPEVIRALYHQFVTSLDEEEWRTRDV